jgi:hypothetical protein
LEEDAMGKFSRVSSDVVDADDKSSQASIEHQHNVTTVGTGAGVCRVKEFGCKSDSVANRFIAELAAIERHIFEVMLEKMLEEMSALGN